MKNTQEVIAIASMLRDADRQGGASNSVFSTRSGFEYLEMAMKLVQLHGSGNGQEAAAAAKLIIGPAEQRRALIREMFGDRRPRNTKGAHHEFVQALADKHPHLTCRTSTFYKDLKAVYGP